MKGKAGFWLVMVAGTLLPVMAFAQAARPFGAPGEGAAAPPGNALVAWILQQQSAFYKSMQAIVSAAADGGSLWPLYGLALAYGVFHAAGPGHGKAVISAYIVANERAAWKAVGVSFGAGAVQAAVAIAAVLVVILGLGLAGRARAEAFGWIELAGYALIALLGLLLFLRKGRSLLRLLRPANDAPKAPHADCDHVHLPGPEVVRTADWRGMTGAMIAAGVRPCTGAIIMLTFCIAQGLYGAGALTVIIMAIGTALTTSAFALVSVYLKGFALGLASGRSRRGEIIARLIEMAAALVIFALGLMLAIGFYAAGPSAR